MLKSHFPSRSTKLEQFAVEQLLKKGGSIGDVINASENTEISPGLRCGDSQVCFYLPSFGGMEEIVASFEPWSYSTKKEV